MSPEAIEHPGPPPPGENEEVEAARMTWIPGDFEAEEGTGGPVE